MLPLVIIGIWQCGEGRAVGCISKHRSLNAVIRHIILYARDRCKLGPNGRGSFSARYIIMYIYTARTVQRSSHWASFGTAAR